MCSGKKIKVHKHHVRGLSDDAIAMMKLRNKARRNKSVEEYKRLRNQCNRIIRRDKLEEAKKQIQENPNNMWKIFNNTFKGKRKDGMKLKEGDKIVDNEKDLSNIFNKFFKDKIENIKDSIETIQEDDPIGTMHAFVARKDLFFKCVQ